ncbi:MAG: TrkH family potassium uptake protein [Acidimicrobiales bacterium]
MIRTESGRYPSVILHVVGLTVLMTGIGEVVSAVVDMIKGGPDTAVLAGLGLATSIVGYLVWRTTEVPTRIRIADVFAVVVAAWIGLAVVGGLPYLATGTLSRPDDAIFEAVSGFTTTGATVLRPIEGTGPGILFWRSLSQWIGGMGVIVLVVAVLPTIGSGGMDLLQAEAPGPTGERLTPKVRHTARRLWGVYLLLTFVVIAGFLLGGMSIYDAVVHSFTTVSTGGFSPYNRSLGHFESAFIEWVAILGMFLAGGSFTLYYRAIRGSVGPLYRSVEFRLYLGAVLGSSAVCYLTNSDEFGYGHDAVRGTLFTVVSIVSTTGYATVDYEQWAEAAQIILLFLMPVGAMAGSTAGGVKYIRVLSVASYAWRDSTPAPPRLVRPIRVGNNIVEEDVAARVAAFSSSHLRSSGPAPSPLRSRARTCGPRCRRRQPRSATWVLACLSSALPDDMRNLKPVARGIVIIEMLLGRLEIYPILLAFAAAPRRLHVRRPSRISS